MNKYRLLIADDEEMVLRGMERYITAHNQYFDKILTASNGTEALDCIVQYHPDVMVIDIKMPGKTGLEVMQAALEMKLCPKTIILSGYDEFSYAQQALRMGAQDYLLKPCGSREMLGKIEEVLLRDHPELEEEKSGEDPADDNRLIRRALSYIDEHLRDELSLGVMAEYVGISPAYFSSLFTKSVGCSFVDYLNRQRIQKACDYMHDDRMKVYEIAEKVGFHDERYFSRVFRRVKGMTPKEYRERGIHEEEAKGD